MKKITVNMMSSATRVKGQGVGSAYIEQVGLIKNGLSEKYSVTENKHFYGADITHFHTINPDYFLLRKFQSRHGKTVGYVHMLPETVEESLNLPRFMKKAFYWYMIKFYKGMDYLVTVNPYFIKRLAAYNIPEKKVTYIPNYVSSEDFHPLNDKDKKALRKKYGIPEDKFTVVCAGQLQVRKGIFDFAEIAEKLPEIEFAWAGGFSFGKMTDGYKEIIKLKENLPDNLKLLGMIERKDMNEVYNLGDVMFLPSYEELFPMTILEAMCANIPIVLRNLDIYPDILFDFYSSAEDNSGFIKELLKLKNDRDYYNARKAASRKGNEFYSKEHVTKMWDKFYSMVYNSKK